MIAEIISSTIAEETITTPITKWIMEKSIRKVAPFMNTAPSVVDMSAPPTTKRLTALSLIFVKNATNSPTKKRYTHVDGHLLEEHGYCPDCNEILEDK